jgi:hypothetical protein
MEAVLVQHIGSVGRDGDVILQSRPDPA